MFDTPQFHMQGIAQTHLSEHHHRLDLQVHRPASPRSRLHLLARVYELVIRPAKAQIAKALNLPRTRLDAAPQVCC